MVTVLVCDIKNLNSKHFFSIMSKYHREKILRFKNEKDHKLMVGSELLLRNYLLERGFKQFPLEILLEGKKPYIKDCNYKFSFSHSKTYACCAISKTNVGVDLEVKRDLSKSFLKKYGFLEDEQEKALIKWNQFESYYKLVNANLSFVTFLQIDKLNIKTKIFENYLISIASQNSEDIIIEEINIDDFIKQDK